MFKGSAHIPSVRVIKSIGMCQLQEKQAISLVTWYNKLAGRQSWRQSHNDLPVFPVVSPPKWASTVVQWLRIYLWCRRQWTGVWSLGGEDPLEEGMAIHSSILAWRMPWVEEAARLQSIGSRRVRHDWNDWARTCTPSKWYCLKGTGEYRRKGKSSHRANV